MARFSRLIVTCFRGGVGLWGSGSTETVTGLSGGESPGSCEVDWEFNGL